MEDSDLSDFPDLHYDPKAGEALRLFDSVARCPICFSPFDAPLSLRTCGHSFCSPCIRENLSFQERQGQPQCPTCRSTCDARDLVPNVALRELIDRYVAARPVILSLAVASSGTRQEEPSQDQHRKRKRLREKDEDDGNGILAEDGPSRKGPGSSPSNDVPRRRSSRRLMEKRRSQEGKGDGSEESREQSLHAMRSDTEVVVDLVEEREESDDGESNDSRSKDDDFDVWEDRSSDDEIDETRQRQSLKRRSRGKRSSGASTSKTQLVDTDDTRGTRRDSTSTTPSGFVNCPVCGRGVPSFYINSHVDQCLLNEGSGKKKNRNGCERNFQTKAKASRKEKTDDGRRAGRRRDMDAQLGTAATVDEQRVSTNEEQGIASKKTLFQPLAVPSKLVPTLVTEKSLRASLRKYYLPTDGRKQELLQRYNSFRLAVQTANDRGEETSYSRIATKVVSQERRRAVAAFLSCNGTNAPKFEGTEALSSRYKLNDGLVMGFQTDSGLRENDRMGVVDATKGGGASERHLPGADGSFSVEFGCSFEELIAVTKARDAARRKKRLDEITDAGLDLKMEKAQYATVTRGQSFASMAHTPSDLSNNCNQLENQRTGGTNGMDACSDKENGALAAAGDGGMDGGSPCRVASKMGSQEDDHLVEDAVMDCMAQDEFSRGDERTVDLGGDGGPVDEALREELMASEALVLPDDDDVDDW